MRFTPEPISRSGYGAAFNVPTFRALQPQVVFELRRARRYEHPLGVVMLGLLGPERARDGRTNGYRPDPTRDVTPATYGLLGAYLSNTLRETDILTGVPELLAFTTFLPGVDRSGAEQAMERFRSGFLECAGYHIRGGVASFPDDGLTLEDIVGRAREGWRLACHADLTSLTAPRYSHG